MPSSVRIQTDDTERIEILALDSSLSPVTGKTDLLISIRRVSDGYFYDFNDDTFKASGWTTRQQAISEVSATNAPGEYYYDFDTSAITNATSNDTYEIRIDQSPGTDVKNLPMTGEVKVGQFVDNIDAAISSRAVPGSEMNLADDAITSAKYDQSTAHPLAQADSAATAVARTGADGDTLETISDQIDGVQTDVTAIAADAAELNDTKITTARANNLDNLDQAISTTEGNIRGTDGDDLKDLSDQLDTAQADLDNPNQYKADVSALAIEANVQGHAAAALTAYDPPTRAEATSDKNEIIAEVNANESKIDLIQTDVTGIVADAAELNDTKITTARANNLDNLDQAISTTESNIRGTDGDDLKDLSDQLDTVQADLDNPDQFKADVSGLAQEANVEGHVTDALNSYDPPTRAEATADKNEIITEVNANEAKIDSVISLIGALNNLSIADVQSALTAQGYTSSRAANLEYLDAMISTRESTTDAAAREAAILAAISALSDLSIADVQTALTNQGYTTVRAALLDNLSYLDTAISTVLSSIVALNDLSQADVQTAMTAQGYTIVRAALLDNLDAAVSAIPSAVDTLQSFLHGAGSWTTGTGGWTTGEKEQLRSALGINGDKTAATGGQLQDVASDVGSVKTKTDLMQFTGNDIHATLDSEEVAINTASINSIRAAIMSYVLESNTLGLTLEESLNMVRKAMFNRLELQDGNTNNWVLYDDDDASAIFQWDVTDKQGGSISLEDGRPARRTRGVAP